MVVYLGIVYPLSFVFSQVETLKNVQALLIILADLLSIFSSYIRPFF